MLQSAPIVNSTHTAPSQFRLAAMCSGVLPYLSVHEIYSIAFGMVRRTFGIDRTEQEKYTHERQLLN